MFLRQLLSSSASASTKLFPPRIATTFNTTLYRTMSSKTDQSTNIPSSTPKKSKSKAKAKSPSETFFHLPSPPSSSPIVDTHTHLAHTFGTYTSRYGQTAEYQNVYDFVRGMYAGKNVDAIVDVWCEAPVKKLWKEFADSAVSEEDRKEKWGGIEYWFVIGVHPHEAKDYNDQVEADLYVVRSLTWLSFF